MQAILDEARGPATRSGAASLPVFMEHRFGRRFRCGSAVRLSVGTGLTGPGRLANVSLSGAYVQTTLDLPLFATLRIANGTNPGEAVELSGSVVRRERGGVGIEWCETPTRSICEIFGCTKHCEVA